MKRIVTIILKNIVRVPGVYLKFHRFAAHPERYSDEEKYRYVQKIFGYAIKSGNIHLAAYGQENIPETDEFLIYANHQGYLDVAMVCYSCKRPAGVLLAKEFYDIPVLKQMIDSTHSLAIDRSDLRQSMQVMQDISKGLECGRSYAIFPEGRVSRGSELSNFHAGSFKCAVKSRCTIIPAALIDTYKATEEKGSRPINAEVHFLPPIKYKEYENLSSIELAQLVKERIEEKVKYETAQKRGREKNACGKK